MKRAVLQTDRMFNGKGCEAKRESRGGSERDDEEGKEEEAR